MPLGWGCSEITRVLGQETKDLEFKFALMKLEY